MACMDYYTGGLPSCSLPTPPININIFQNYTTNEQLINNYDLKINQFLMFGCSIMLAFFYFIAIPTVIRSRLTTDTSAMSSLGGKKAQVVKVLNEKQVLVNLGDKQIVVNKNEDRLFEEMQDVILSEDDGKLSI